MTMSVVGLTLGKAAKAMRPAIASAASAATRATTCDGGRERSYQAKPASMTAPRISEAGQLPAHRRRLPSQRERRALLGGDDPGQVEDAGDLGGEVPAAGEDLGGRAVGDHHAVAEQHDALGEARRRTRRRGWRRRPPRRASGEARRISSARLVLARAVHAAGRLVEGDEPGELAALHAAGQRDRQRQPLPLAAGEVARVGVDRVLQADDPQRREPLRRPAARRRPARGPGSRSGSG